jgi:hypothetical protein
MSIKIHSRFKRIQTAKLELSEIMVDLQGRHELTDLETAKCLIEETQEWMKYMLRSERHPDDPPKKTDEE